MSQKNVFASDHVPSLSAKASFLPTLLFLAWSIRPLLYFFHFLPRDLPCSSNVFRQWARKCTSCCCTPAKLTNLTVLLVVKSRNGKLRLGLEIVSFRLGHAHRNWIEILWCSFLWGREPSIYDFHASCEFFRLPLYPPNLCRWSEDRLEIHYKEEKSKMSTFKLESQAKTVTNVHNQDPSVHQARGESASKSSLP